MRNEILQRQQNAKSFMRKNGFNALVFADADNIQYFTGVVEPSIHACGIVILPQQAQSVLAVLWPDKEAALEKAKESIVKTYAIHNQGEVISRTLEQLKVIKGTIGVDNRSLRWLGNSLKQCLPNVELVNISYTTELRLVKAEKEIILIKKSCEIAEQGMKIALESIKPGITELELAALAEYQMMKLGSDKLKHNTVVASGYRTRLVHPFASQKKITTGDLVVIDLGAVYGGYCSDIARTFVVGRLDEETKNAFYALRTVQDVILQKLRPGLSVRELESLAQEATKTAGYSLLGHVGHSIGLQVEEHPWFMTKGLPYADVKIEKNMVLAIFQSSIERRGTNLGIRLEDTALITESGAKMLTNYPRELFSSAVSQYQLGS